MGDGFTEKVGETYREITDDIKDIFNYNIFSYVRRQE